MLPKIWKKFLLAICIIACIYNVMSKLVNRNSLEINLKSVDDGTTVFNLFEKSSENVEEPINESQENISGEKINTENVVTEENPVEETAKENEEQEEVATEDNQEETTKKNKETKFIVLY